MRNEKCFGFIAFFFIHIHSFAQIVDCIKKPSLAIHFLFDDFNTSDYLHGHPFNESINHGQFANIKNMRPGLAASYLQGLSNHIDFSASLAFSSLDYPARNGTGNSLGNGSKNILFETDVSVIAKILTDCHRISPLVQLGVGFSAYSVYYGAFIPVGVGLQFRITHEAFVLFNTQYRAALTNRVDNHFYYSLGIAGKIGNGRRKKTVSHNYPMAKKPIMDRDGDGIVDSLDACPDVPGLRQFEGCPDTDGDGIPDNIDKCPTVPGFARYQGCPIPDTDGDGINDEEDKCPTVPGYARYQGCPIPDSDGDGVNDEEDRCPLIPGPRENQGCPLVKQKTIDQLNFYAKNIFFAVNKYELLPKSFHSLKEIADILKQDTALRLEINGHTDNTGTIDKNQLLSENRAKAILNYLRDKTGVEERKLKATGYGARRPLATNKTIKGKALNRRVEMRLNY
jgi:OOP family OmpA-OmpF porin